MGGGGIICSVKPSVEGARPRSVRRRDEGLLLEGRPAILPEPTFPDSFCCCVASRLGGLRQVLEPIVRDGAERAGDWTVPGCPGN